MSMDNQGFELKSEPADDPRGDPPPYTIGGQGAQNPGQNGYSNGRVSPANDPELAAAKERHGKEKEKRDQDPLRFIRWISERTGLWFGLTLGGQIFFVVLTAILVAAKYDILPITFDRVPLDIRGSQEYLRGLAWDSRNEDVNNIVDRASSADAIQDQQGIQYDALGMIFSSGNVFTKENLEEIQKTENAFSALADMDKYCLREEGTTNCSKPESVIRFFDGTYKADYPQLDDPQFARIPYILNEANNIEEFKRTMKRYLAKDAVITATEATSSLTLSLIMFGWPLEGYANDTDREKDQEGKFDTFFRDKVMPKGDEYFSNGVGGMDFSYGSNFIIGLWISRQVIFDLALAIGSFAFIGIFMTIQTGSVWITGWTIFSIMTGFCGANLIYRIILDFRYVGVFHVLAVFIVLGIGADDVFIFVDTWKETAHHSYKSLAHRMSDCYRKASMAMLFTSLTTAIAFFVSASSPFLGIYSFGVFSGVLIIVNYISVITFLPCVVLMYHKHFEKFKCCCCCRKPGWSPDPSTPSKAGASRTNPIVRFFAGPYFKLVTHPIARWIIILFYVILLSVFIYFASTLQVNEEQVKFVDDKVAIGKYIADISKFQSNEERNAQVYIVFGIETQNRDKCHHTDTECIGTTVWDNDFSLNNQTSQEALQNWCNEMLAYDNNTDWVKRLRIKMSDAPNPQPEIRCFPTDIQKWFNASTTRPAGLEFPISQPQVESIMTLRAGIYTNKPGNYTSWVETGTSYWIYNAFFGFGEQYLDYNKLIGEQKVDGKTQVTKVESGDVSFDYYYGTSMKYLAIVVNTTMDAATLGYPTGIPILEDWDKFIEEKRPSLPDTLKGVYQCTPQESAGFNLWHWLLVQQKLVNSALVGIVIGVCTALPILILATHNVLTGLYATLTILLIVVMVLGFIPMVGWKLGLLESVNLVLLVGLSVDYVVHLAEAYSRSARDDRRGRVHDMLQEVGISVLSGAVTTLGASIFLLAAKILFFVQFGLFMFCTIGFSILFALGLFVTVVAIIGPQGTTGDIYACFRKCCKKNSEE